MITIQSSLPRAWMSLFIPIKNDVSFHLRGSECALTTPTPNIRIRISLHTISQCEECTTHVVHLDDGVHVWFQIILSIGSLYNKLAMEWCRNRSSKIGGWEDESLSPKGICRIQKICTPLRIRMHLERKKQIKTKMADTVLCDRYILHGGQNSR